MNNCTVLIKPSSSNCNLNCSYCFYKDVAKNRDVFSNGIMSIDTLENIIKDVLDSNIDNCDFMFQGGEPTLVGLEFYENLINLQNKYNKNDINISNSIQTNCISIDDKFAKFFFDNNFLVGVSLDGPRFIHDKYRVDYLDKGSFDDVIKGISLLRKYDVNFNILSVVTRESVKYIAEIYSFFKANNFNHLQFIPCIKNFDNLTLNNISNFDYYLNANDYYIFLDTLFNLWFNDVESGIFIEIKNFIDYITVLKGYVPTSCGMGGFCSIHNVIESNGDVYPCDFYCIDKYKLGNINYDKLNNMRFSSISKEFFNRSLYVHDNCKICNYFKLCGGGCRRNLEPYINGIPSLNYQCYSIKKFLDKNLDKLIHLSRLLKY